MVKNRGLKNIRVNKDSGLMAKELAQEIRCIKCGNWHTLHTDEYKCVMGFYLIKITGVPYYKCDYCGDILLTPEMCDAIDSQFKLLKKDDE